MRAAGSRKSLFLAICYRCHPFLAEPAVSAEAIDDPSHNDAAEADAMFDAAARHCLDNPDRAAFLDWFADAGPGIAPALAADVEASGGPVARFFRLFGAAIYNELPLPQHRFRASRTPLPGRNEPCLCGSGEKFKQCCAALAASLDLSEYNALAFVLEHLPESRYAELASSPVDVLDLGDVAEQWRLDDQHARVVALLAPWFEARTKLGGALEFLFVILTGSYFALGRTADADRLMQLAIERGDKGLRAAAIRERSLQRLDNDDIDGAWEDFAEVRRLEPSHPSNAVLELTLLISTQRYDDARARARFWLPRLERDRDLDAEHIIELVRRVIDDPRTALQAPPIDRSEYPELAQLDALLAAAPPIAVHHIVAAHDDGEHLIEADARLRRLEGRWADVFPSRKPMLTGLYVEHDEAWAEPERWLEVLAQESLAWQSFEVLDDLVLLVADLLGDGARDPLFDALLARAVALLRLHVAPAGNVSGTLPWGSTDNRPALRLLAQAAYSADEDPASGAASDAFLAAAELLLALNPSDNHGIRDPLSLGYLQRDQPARALAVLERFPEDLCGPALNQMLALYMAGREADARAALAAARPRHDLALRTLVDEQAKCPPEVLQQVDLVVGGPAEAWHYRAAARGVWARADALVWLREAL